MKIPEEKYHFQNPAEWRTWLESNHASAKEAWLIIDKASVTHPNMTLPQAIEEALCFGWVDSILQTRDASTYVLRFTPRKARSIWSVSNQTRVARLIEEGRMTEAGMARIEEAKANGEWEAAIRREDLSAVPEALAQALAEAPEIQAKFEALAPSHKKAYLTWINSAKTSPTREKRVQKAVEMLAQGKRLGQ